MEDTQSKEYECQCGAVFFSDGFLKEHAETIHPVSDVKEISVNEEPIADDEFEPQVEVITTVSDGPGWVPVDALAQSIPVVPPFRTSTREYRIIANSDGKMVCENGPCLCGVGRKEWHTICCKP